MVHDCLPPGAFLTRNLSLYNALPGFRAIVRGHPGHSTESFGPRFRTRIPLRTHVGPTGTGNDSPVCRPAVRLWLVTITLWVDAWQMQCCGEPFRLGSQVAWTLRGPDPDWLEAVLGAEASRAVNAAEEHHGGIPEDTEPVRGIVTRIWAVHCRYAPGPDDGPRTLYPALGSGVLTDVESADGWIADRGEERFVGYVVRLDQVNRGLDDDLVAHREAELALLAARFSLPGTPHPDVDQAIDLACRLLAGNLETPATIEVACLSYGTPLKMPSPSSGRCSSSTAWP